MTFGELAARFLAEGDREALACRSPEASAPVLGRGAHRANPQGDGGRLPQAAATPDKTVTDTTINRDLEALRHILFWATDEGLLALKSPRPDADGP